MMGKMIGNYLLFLLSAGITVAICKAGFGGSDAQCYICVLIETVFWKQQYGSFGKGPID